MDIELNYAPAAGSVLADTVIFTGSEGIETGFSRLAASDGALPVYWAKPEGQRSLPVIVVLSEAFGLHAHIADIARRFAMEGYLAIAPNLMARQGDPMAFDDVGSLVKDLLLHIPDAQVMRDIDACVDWAIETGGVADRIGVTGFCWGGRWAWLYAAHRQLACAMPWYGILDGKSSGIFPDDPERFPTHPVDIAKSLKTPVMGFYGGLDSAISMDSVELMRHRLAAGNSTSKAAEIMVYPNAGHAFFADYRDSYEPGAAADAWERCLAFLRTSLGGM